MSTISTTKARRLKEEGRLDEAALVKGISTTRTRLFQLVPKLRGKVRAKAWVLSCKAKYWDAFERGGKLTLLEHIGAASLLIEAAIVSLEMGRHDKAIANLLMALEFVVRAEIEADVKLSRKDWARMRHALDPKQVEKSFILECWQNWQAVPASYSSKAAFARDMLTKCEFLKSQKKIEDWCREWESGNGTQQA